MSDIQNLMIIASAGCGKTHRLVSRYLELLEKGVEPEKIIALTFTREASGEFLDSIFERLVQAARRPGESAAAQARLRLLVEKLPRLSLGTLDSFFARILRAFPLECGLVGELTPLDDYTAGIGREEAIESLLRDSISSPKRFQDFMELLRQQNRSQEQREIVDQLDTTVKKLHEKYLLTPAGLLWGSQIWPQGNPWEHLPEPASLVAAVRAQVEREHSDLNEKQLAKWAAFFDETERLIPGGKLTAGIEWIAGKIIDRLQEQDSDQERTISIYKKIQFSESLWLALVELIRSLIGSEIRGCIARSAALHELMAAFETIYQSQIRSGGRLTFLDVTGLLARAAGAHWGGANQSRINREEIDFRIDGRFDHWLIDEFQDTSRLQWAALANLVDEVIQDPSGRRSFFYVGDIKQAIYAWRGGDPKLFQEIFEHYHSEGSGRLQRGEPLHQSYRSRPEILEAVNRIFGSLPRLGPEMEIPHTTVDRWQTGWSKPTSALQEAKGWVNWQTSEDVQATLVELIQTARPLERGLSCAVLVQRNDTILDVVDALRQAGIPASEETFIRPCTDNPAGAALLAVFRLLAHPSDKLAMGHVSLTPFVVLLEGGGATFVENGRTDIIKIGYAATARRWIKRILPTNEPFVQGRLDAWVDAAAAFESGAVTGLDAFLRFMEDYQIRESESASSVRVMTFHRSKGLGFDWVILPELTGNKLTELRSDSLFMKLDKSGEVEWGMDLPKQKIRQFDPVLGAAMEEAEADAAYEALCKYYVALTRAKKAMHLLTPPPPKKSSSMNFIRLLTLTLGEPPYENGSADWYEQFPIQADPAPTWLPSSESYSPPKTTQPAAAIPVFKPSQWRKPTFTAAELLSESRYRARAHGNEIHAQLEVASLAELPFPEKAPVRRFFGPPAPDERVWSEKAFEVRVGDQWMRGVFDRVILNAKGATLLEFKTENLPAAELLERHKGQLSAYREALSRLTNLSIPNLRVYLVPVSTGELIEWK